MPYAQLVTAFHGSSDWTKRDANATIILDTPPAMKEDQDKGDADAVEGRSGAQPEPATPPQDGQPMPPK